jgi:hypothetical protein
MITSALIALAVLALVVRPALRRQARRAQRHGKMKAPGLTGAFKEDQSLGPAIQLHGSPSLCG